MNDEMSVPVESVTTEQMLACVDRELKMRKRVYPRWVEKKKMLASTMMLELARMRAVRERLFYACAMQTVLDGFVENGAIAPDSLADILEAAEMDCRANGTRDLSARGRPANGP